MIFLFSNLVLPQVSIPDLVDAPRKTLPFLRSEFGMGKGRWGWEKRGGELGLGCKMEKQFNKKNEKRIKTWSILAIKVLTAALGRKCAFYSFTLEDYALVGNLRHYDWERSHGKNLCSDQ